MSQDFNRLTKINFDTRLAETSKNLATKRQLENTLDLGDKHREKMTKIQTFSLS